MPETQPISQRPGNSKTAWITVGAVLVLGVLLQQYFKMSGGSGNPSGTPRPDAPAEKITVEAKTGGWKSYTNEKTGFSIQYPENVNLRGTAESDLAILTLPTAETSGKSALITLTKKKVPLNKEPYATMEAFWEDEKGFIAANSGVVSNERYVTVNDRTFWEAREDNRQTNYMGLHRYIKEGDAIYEVTLTVEGDKLIAAAQDRYNEILTTLTIN